MRPTPRPSTRGSKMPGIFLSKPLLTRSVSAWSLSEVKEQIQEAKSRIAERLLGKPAANHHPEESVSPTAYVASSNGQMDLI